MTIISLGGYKTIGHKLVTEFMLKDEKRYDAIAKNYINLQGDPINGGVAAFSIVLQKEFTQYEGSFPSQISAFQEHYMDEIEGSIPWEILAQDWIDEAFNELLTEESKRIAAERYDEDRSSMVSEGHDAA